MLSLEYMPCFYRLARSSKNTEDYLADFLRGGLSPEAKKIMDALTERSPQITSDLKLSSGMAHPSKRSVFDRGMAELQYKMYVTKIAEFYDPFTFLWDLVDRQFVAETAAAQDISPENARFKILEKYFLITFVANFTILQRLFGWPRPFIEETIDRLEQEGIILSGVKIEGEKQTFFAVTNF